MYRKFSRLYALPGKVSVYRLGKGSNKVFLRYENNEGQEIDEQGKRVGVVKFKYKGVLV